MLFLIILLFVITSCSYFPRFYGYVGQGSSLYWCKALDILDQNPSIFWYVVVDILVLRALIFGSFAVLVCPYKIYKKKFLRHKLK